MKGCASNSALSSAGSRGSATGRLPLGVDDGKAEPEGREQPLARGAPVRPDVQDVRVAQAQRGRGRPGAAGSLNALSEDLSNRRSLR